MSHFLTLFFILGSPRLSAVMPSFSKNGYTPVVMFQDSTRSSDSGEDEGAAFLGEKSTSLHTTRSMIPLVALTIANIIIFIISTALFGTWFYNTHMQLNAKLRQASSYSPVHDLIDLNPQTQRINGTLFPDRHHPSIARQSPNPSADAIWHEWELTRFLPISAAQIRAMGKDPSTASKLEDRGWGLGDDAYVAIYDVYHQLHCLNQLREMAYPHYYNASESHMKKKEGMYEIHLNHCVDILMQALQCSGNVNLITMHWVETQEYPFPDMSVNRQCVDFERLTNWRRENSLDMDKYEEVMKKPRGVKQLKAPDGYYKYYQPERENPNHINGANPDEDFNL